MGDLLIRRRMLVPSEPNPLVYSLYNQSFSAGDSFSTGFKAFDADVACTILLDVTISSRPTSGNGANFKLIFGGANAFSYGTRNTSATNLYYYWFNDNSYTDAGTSYTAGARYRICVKHSANSNYVYVRTKKNTGTRNDKSSNKTFSAKTSVLCFGNPNGTNGLPNGTITKAEVYNVYYSDTDDIIVDFFA